MTKKDYELIATVIRRNHKEALELVRKDTGETYSNAQDHIRGIHDMQQIEKLVSDLSVSFGLENALFSSEKFQTACGFTRYGISNL